MNTFHIVYSDSSNFLKGFNISTKGDISKALKKFKKRHKDVSIIAIKKKI